MILPNQFALFSSVEDQVPVCRHAEVIWLYLGTTISALGTPGIV